MQIKSKIIQQALCSMCDIPDEEWAKIESLFGSKSLKKGEILLEQGEASNQFYFITKGLVRFYYTTSDGKEYNKNFHTENEFIGSLLTIKKGIPSTFSIQALEPCELISISYTEFNKLFESHPCWERIGRIMAEELAMKKELREKEFLLDTAEVRYNSFKNEFSDHIDRINLGQIASYLGITQVQLSRIRKNIK
jgi:CRP-like cAMP-binding protein